MDKFAGQRIKEALKRQLRFKKVGYKDLAEHLDCSVPTVKRILSSEELSLSRLLEILQFLDLSLSEIELLSNDGESKDERYSVDQENFLVKNPHFMSYLLKLCEGKTPKQIAETYSLNQRSTDKYLIGLEKMLLIRVTGKQKIIPTILAPNFGNGPLAKAYMESIIRSSGDLFIKMINDAIFSLDSKKENGAPKTYVFQSHKVSTATYRKWMSEQQKHLADFMNAAQYEEKTLDASELQTVVIMEGVSLVPNDYSGLKIMDDMFGKIIPL